MLATKIEKLKDNISITNTTPSAIIVPRDITNQGEQTLLEALATPEVPVIMPPTVEQSIGKDK